MVLNRHPSIDDNSGGIFVLPVPCCNQSSGNGLTPVSGSAEMTIIAQEQNEAEKL